MSKRMSKAMRNVNTAVRVTNRATDQLSRGFRRLGVASAAAAAGLGLVTKNVVDVGSGFEEAIAAVGAVQLKTRDQIVDLEEKAKSLGATTKFTATEAANAMEIMAKAGFNSSQILSGVDGVLAAAAASGLEIAEVADHVSNALKGMGLEASEATRVADVLALASSRTNSTIGTLGESIRNVASTARQLKVPFEDVTAAVALLQDVGLDASVAGSAMNTMLTKMAKPTDAVAAKMKKMGISFKDAKGNMLPFTSVIGQLNKAGEKAGGTFDKVAFFADLVGLRGQKAAANLADLFKKGKLKELTHELNNATGAADKMAKLRMDTLRGDWTLLKSAVDAVKVALFDAESGPLRAFVQRMTDWVGKNQDKIVASVGRAIDGLKEAAKAAEPIVATFLDAFKGGFKARDAADSAMGSFRDFVGWLKKKETMNAAAEWGKLLGKAASALLTLGELLVRYLPEMLYFMIATKLAKGAMIAYETAVGAVTAAKALYRIATDAATASTIRSIGKTIASAGAFVGHKIAAVASAGANVILAGSFTAVATAAGLALAAITALYAAFQQLQQLQAEIGGMGLFELAEKFLTTDKGLFEIVDEHMNEQARREARQRKERDAPQAAMVTPQDRAAAATAEEAVQVNMGKGEITIRDETGRAHVTKIPEGMAMQLQQSGAFAQ